MFYALALTGVTGPKPLTLYSPLVYLSWNMIFYYGVSIVISLSYVAFVGVAEPEFLFSET